MSHLSSGHWTVNTISTVNDDDDDPLLRGDPVENDDLKTSHVILSDEETHRLVECLTDVADLLTQNVDINSLVFKEAQIHQSRGEPTASSCLRLWKRVRTRFWHTVHRFTGGLGIAATIVLQMVCLVMLSLVDALPQTSQSKNQALYVGSIGMIVLQSVNLLVVILVSVQLFHQIHVHRVSRVLLIQSFVATILLFAGIYTATYRLDRNSWKFVTRTQDQNPVRIVTVDYIEFLFFSVSTATLCGAADSLPNEWYTSLFACIQMLLSFVYFTSVLGPSVSESDVNQATFAAKLHALRERLRRQQESRTRDILQGT